MIKTASREQLLQILRDLSREYGLAAPVLRKKGRRERVDFAPLDSPEQIYLERRPDSSPKGFFLPQNETMDGAAAGEERKTILLGLRPCDLQALQVLDDVYLTGDYVDAYYEQHRRNTVVIGYSCPAAESSCFCSALGIDPLENESAPLFLFQDGERFLIKLREGGSPGPETADRDTGELTGGLSGVQAGINEALAGITAALQGLDDADEAELEELLEERKAQFREQDFRLDLPVPLSEGILFQAPFWEQIAEKCLGCGSCTFYCPTCYCFGFIWDEGEKIRGWDSCMFASFTRHASGHNPRTAQSERYRQRLLHKYSYHPINYSGLACTGCGRCLDNCPVNLDLRAALKTVENYLKQEGGVKDG